MKTDNLECKWRTNIENSAEMAVEKHGQESVVFILAKYGASCLEELPDQILPDVWSELSLIAEED